MSANSPTANANDPISAAREGTGPCPKCRTWLPLLVDCARTYFEHGLVQCKQCGERVDLWQASLDQATRLSNFFSDSALISLGARQNWFTLLMESGKHYFVDLTKYKIPEDAKILSRRYSPQGGELGAVTAVEWYPHDSTHRFRGTPLSLLAIPLLEGPPLAGQVLIILTWVGSDDSDAWPYLATAFDSAAAREYAPALVFAQSAVEISMMPLLEKRLLGRAPAERVDRFLTEALTYNHALNVMLPYFCGEMSAPRMPDNIRGSLNKLRKTRNAIIHKGTKAAAITPTLAIEGLCAATFGFEYMRFIEPFFLGRRDDQQS